MKTNLFKNITFSIAAALLLSISCSAANEPKSITSYEEGPVTTFVIKYAKAISRTSVDGKTYIIPGKRIMEVVVTSDKSVLDPDEISTLQVKSEDGKYVVVRAFGERAKGKGFHAHKKPAPDGDHPRDTSFRRKGQGQHPGHPGQGAPGMGQGRPGMGQGRPGMGQGRPGMGQGRPGMGQGMPYGQRPSIRKAEFVQYTPADNEKLTIHQVEEIATVNAQTVAPWEAPLPAGKYYRVEMPERRPGQGNRPHGGNLPEGKPDAE